DPGLVRASHVLLTLRRLGLGLALRRSRRRRDDLVVGQAQAARAAREQGADDLGEVAGDLLERLGEAAVDRLRQVADQPAQLAQRLLEVGALLGQLAGAALLGLVLLGRQRVDGAEALAAALQALHAGGHRLALLGRQRLVERRGRVRDVGGDLLAAAAELGDAIGAACELDLDLGRRRGHRAGGRLHAGLVVGAGL